MKQRVLPVALLITSLAIVVGSCSTSESADDSGKSGGQENAAEQSARGSEASDKSAEETQADIEASQTDIHESLENLDESLDNLPDQISECAELSARYSTLLAASIGASAGDTADSANELKSILPAEMHDDVDYLESVMEKVEASGFANSADLLESLEFQDAREAISGYVTQTCAD